MSSALISLLLYYRYVIVLPIALVEGPVISMISGLLVHYNYFNFWIIYPLLMVADLIGDTFWYFVGYFGGPGIMRSRAGKYIHADEIYNAAQRLYQKHHEKILFFSKLTMGLGLPALVLSTAGAIKIPYRKYIAINALGQIFWTGGLMAIGYFLGDVYQMFDQGLHIFSLVSLAVVLLLIVYFISRLIRRKAIQAAENLSA